MLRRPMMGRGRPGLLGTMARTAVVAGTATATAGAVAGWRGRREQERAQQQAAEQAVLEQQQELRRDRQQTDPSQAAPGGQPAPPGGDLTARLRQLADLNASGALSDAEFAAAKSKLLGT
jgi:type II secretory pathway pseudopilin PulG